MDDKASQRRGVGFDDRNVLLLMILGLISWRPWLDALLNQESGSEISDATPTPSPDERLLDAALGAIALSARFNTFLADLPLAPPPTDLPSPTDDLALDELIR